MSHENRIDFTQRAIAYQPPSELARERARTEASVTGIEKSTALADAELLKGSAGSTRDRGQIVNNTTASQGIEKIPALSFSDLIDIVNPLQHIPVVSSIYRSITGDEISNPARVAGSTLFFGPLGAAASVANIAIEDHTGKDIGEHVVSLLPGDFLDTSGPDALADAINRDQDSSDGHPASSDGALFAISSLEENESLSPDKPFTFSENAPEENPAAPRVIGFASTDEPVSIDALPADILAALYSGQPVNTANQQGGLTANLDDPHVEPGTNGHSNIGHPAQVSDTAPRWSLWTTPDGTPTSPGTAAQAYGGVVPNEPVSAGGVASQGGWYGATMPEILARYNDSASLQRQAMRPFIDVSQ